LALGGVLGLLPLLVYDQLAFGSPFTLGYSKVVGFGGMQQGFFGITWPHPSILVELLFGLYRGLLPLSPVLVLVPVGLYVMWREPNTRIAAGAILFVLCSFFWINASYYYWNGGWSTGPRHLVPMLPLCCLALAFAWPRAFWARTVALVLLAASLVLSLICAVAGMFAPSDFSNPLIDFLLPRFLTPVKLLRSLPIVLVWIAFGLLFLRDGLGRESAAEGGWPRPKDSGRNQEGNGESRGGNSSTASGQGCACVGKCPEEPFRYQRGALGPWVNLSL
jgi:hypothetical protein